MCTTPSATSISSEAESPYPGRAAPRRPGDSNSYPAGRKRPATFPTSGEVTPSGKWRGRAQALVEFALVAPVVLLLIGGSVDMGRGLLLYALLQGASRDTARQAALAYY